MSVFFKLLKDGRLPEKQTHGSAGYDLFAAHDVEIAYGDVELVKLGFCMELPKGLEAQIRSRSGLALKRKVFVLNAPGTIDSDYRDEVGVLLMNLDKEKFVVKKHDRIAQMVFVSYLDPLLEEVEELSKSNRSGGFGSTGY